MSFERGETNPEVSEKELKWQELVERYKKETDALGYEIEPAFSMAARIMILQARNGAEKKKQSLSVA